MTFVELNLENRLLECHLSKAERDVRADQAAERSSQAGLQLTESEAAKRRAATTKKESEALGKEAARLLEVYKKGVEDREVQVRCEFDLTRELVVFTRLDTNQAIEERPPSIVEWQQIRAKRQHDLPHIGRSGRGKPDQPS